MSRTNDVHAPTPPAAENQKLNLICGAGGSRAILGSAGAIAACELAGLTDWETLGGVSGGSIPTVLLAAGYTPAQLLKFAVELDFSSLVTRHATPLSTVIAFLLKDRFEYTRPKKGVLSSDKLGDFMDQLVPTWPKNYWTMAVVARTQVLFTADGVYQYLRNGHRRKLSDTPAPVGLAIRASCAVPGIIDAVPYNGRHLFDGALSWDGQCPVHVLPKHFNAKLSDVIACDVGEEKSGVAKVIRQFWGLLCGKQCLNPINPETYVSEGVTLIHPKVVSVRSLQFNLTADQKWQAVMAGFVDAVEKLAARGLLTGDRLVYARQVASDINLLKGLAAK